MLHGSFAVAGSQGLPRLTAPPGSAPDFIDNATMHTGTACPAAWNASGAFSACRGRNAPNMACYVCWRRVLKPSSCAERPSSRSTSVTRSTPRRTITRSYVDILVNTITTSPRVLVGVATSRLPLPRLCHHHRRRNVAPYPYISVTLAQSLQCISCRALRRKRISCAPFWHVSLADVLLAEGRKGCGGPRFPSEEHGENLSLCSTRCDCFQLVRNPFSAQGIIHASCP